MAALHATSNTLVRILEDTPFKDYRSFAVFMGGAAMGLASRSLALRVMGAYTGRIFSGSSNQAKPAQNKNAPG